MQLCWTLLSEVYIFYTKRFGSWLRCNLQVIRCYYTEVYFYFRYRWL